jgi:hypothetical protein
MLDVEHIGIISDEMREVVEEIWPELARLNAPQQLFDHLVGASEQRCRNPEPKRLRRLEVNH